MLRLRFSPSQDTGVWSGELQSTMGLPRAAAVMPLGLHSARASMAARDPPASSPQTPILCLGRSGGKAYLVLE